MSIYPVRLNEWFPVTDPNYMGDVMVYYSCHACGKRPNYKKAWGQHSIPFGHGKVWCSKKCMDSGKVARPDKRRERSFKRRYKECFKGSLV